MSTFGKKALIWWDYENTNKKRWENQRRFDNSPKELQLQILEKWYPIGTICNDISYLGEQGNLIIIGYQINNTGNYLVLLEKKIEYTYNDKDKNTKEPCLTSLTVTRGIGAIMPTRQEMINIKRDDKLKRILSSEK